MKLLYYIAAIGNPELELKLSTINHNINYLSNKIDKKIDLILNIYSNKNEILQYLNKNNNINEIYLYYKEDGILTELFLNNIHNNKVNNYDYIIFGFDDVKINSLNFYDMIYYKDKYNIELLSPFINNAKNDFMYNFDNNKLYITNFLEIYFLLLKPQDFKTFLNIYNVENKFMLGTDFLFGYYNIKVGLIGNNYCDHLIKSKESDNSIKRILQDKYINTYTKFNNLNDIINNYKVIKKSFDFEINKKIDVNIINLKKDTERLKIIQQNIPLKFYNIFNAFNGNNIEQNINGIEYFNEFKKLKTKLNNGQIGCFISHLLLWKKMIDENIEYMFILEDDALFSCEFNRIYNYIQKNIDKYNDGILYLGGRFDNNFKPINKDFYKHINQYIYKYNHSIQNLNNWDNKEYDRTTLSYIISNKVANTLFNNYKSFIHSPVDFYLINIYLNKLIHIYNSNPLICNINKKFNSNIY